LPPRAREPAVQHVPGHPHPRCGCARGRRRVELRGPGDLGDTTAVAPGRRT
jgi:hypothetical protein